MDERAEMTGRSKLIDWLSGNRALSRRLNLAATVACAILAPLSLILPRMLTPSNAGLAGAAIAAFYFLVCIVPAIAIALITAIFALVHRFRKNRPPAPLAFAPIAIVGVLFVGMTIYVVLSGEPTRRSPPREPRPATAIRSPAA